MPQTKIVWTVLPYGFVPKGEPHEGELRLSIVVAPRLTGASKLQDFREFLNWPNTLARLRFGLKYLNANGSQELAQLDVERLTVAEPTLWANLFGPQTPVDDFAFKDMARVNFRSFAVRNVLKFIRQQYEQLATMAPTERPRLLPWREADPSLKGMLTALGIPERPDDAHKRAWSFDRFLDFENGDAPEQVLRRRVFSSQGIYKPKDFPGGFIAAPDGSQVSSGTPIRALPPDWRPQATGQEAQVMGQFNSEAEYDFYQANRFYTRPENRSPYVDRPQLKNVDPPPKAPTFDFHRIVASFADYPSLLRRLGLVIDVVPKGGTTNALLAALGSNPVLEGALALWPQPDKTGPWADDSFPITAFRLTKRRFVTRARTSELKDGLLPLRGASDNWKRSEGAYDVYQVDPDGAALKTANFLLSAQNLVTRSVAGKADGEVTYTTGDRQGVAALRSGSIGVSCHGRAGRVAMGAASAALKNAEIDKAATSAGRVLLYAEDVLRGYRVDVYTVSTQKWNSLCWREGEYRLTKANVTLKHRDEGYVKGASTTSKEGSDDHYLHESLFRWGGWSLVVDRPGRTIVAEDGAAGLQGETVKKVDDVAAQNTGVVARFTASKGSLPKLRFGEDYRLRARLVDLAGNSLDPADPSLGNPVQGEFDQASDPVPYRRFEPIDPPALVQRDRLSEGEALERLVIRGNVDIKIDENTRVDTATDIPPHKYVTEQAFANAKTTGFDYPPEAVRHVIPPKTSQLQAEAHGCLDADIANGAAGIRKVYEICATREARSVFDVAGVELVTPASATQATTTNLPLSLPSPQKPTGDRLAGGQYVIFPDDPNGAKRALPTPYLPDDAACGIALRHVPGATVPGRLGNSAWIVQGPGKECVVLVTFPGSWHDRKGLRIVVKPLEGALDAPNYGEQPTNEKPPEYSEDASTGVRELTIYIRRGRIARLRYSSFVSSLDLPEEIRPKTWTEYIDTLGIPEWISSAAAKNDVKWLASIGCHWMITPDRPLVLVHATQQPVFRPQFKHLSISRRALGQTSADLVARLRMHGPSTGKFEVFADWAEIVDDPAIGPPKVVSGEGQLAEVNLPENFQNEFGLDEVIALNEAAAVEHLSNPSPGTQQRARGNRHEFGDTKFRLVRYRIRATTRFREYLPPKLMETQDKETPENITRVGEYWSGDQFYRDPAKKGLPERSDLAAPVLPDAPNGTGEGFLVVKNSARPPSPSVVYVVPTFKWTRSIGTGNGTHTSTRYGNGLRVYLDRPWFASGEGELLGVVILGEGKKFTEITDRTRPFVTQWGRDPLFDSLLPDTQTSAGDFPLKVAVEDVTLEELPLEGLTLLSVSSRPLRQKVTVVGHRVQWDGERGLWYSDIELDPGRTYTPFVRLALVRYQPHSEDDAKVSRVVLAEFAQLLPRRAVALKRDGQALKLTVRGPAPEYGPMKYPGTPTDRGDSPYTNKSPTGPALLESGRNRLEVVLQTRDPSIVSDLAWSDAGVLLSTLIDPAAAGVSGTVVPVPAPPPAPPSGGVVIGPRERVRIRPGVRIPGFNTEAAIAVDISILDVFDPALWTGSVKLPALDKPSRLVVREFERYYGDGAGYPEPGDSTGIRRMVEERLVYAEYFPLN